MLSLYDITVPNLIRTLDATAGVMQKGLDFFTTQNIEIGEILNMRLADDMLPFHSQINIAAHNALAGVQGMFDGEFRPPQTSLENLDYAGLIKHLTDTSDALKKFNQEEVNARFGKPLYFKFSDQSVPFTTENFMQSFALPNVYFHATTIYDMLRLKGVPLGKRDFLGQLKVGIPE
ncbi:DUF1993 family protein [Paraglaciecola sp.]|uniref:DUF1993 family protein n=1 Tax=Paraglaciecola sp. TaxID=1920173 RepID=UPI003EF1C450